MAIVIAIANQKGGTGKTTTAVNVAGYLSCFGNRVLLVDVDPQGNATSGFGLSKDPPTLYEVLTGEVDIESAIRPVEGLKNLFLIPANNHLTGIEVELIGIPKREYRLYQKLKVVKEGFDVIILDCPPSLSLLTVMGLCSADRIIVPVQAEFYALEGLAQLMNTIGLIRERLNPALELLGVVITMFDVRTNLSNSVVEEVRKFFEGKVFSTVIPRNVRLSEAPSHGKPIFLYDSASTGAKTYYQLSLEICARTGLKTDLH